MVSGSKVPQKYCQPPAACSTNHIAGGTFYLLAFFVIHSMSICDYDS